MQIVKHVGIALIAASVAWGCTESNTVNEKPTPTRSAPQQDKAETPNQPDAAASPQNVAPSTPDAASGELDAYGREPGHAHYGHDHPRQDQEQGNPMMQQQNSPVKTQQDAPASGELDKYGRAPGDEHYGHDHP